MIPASPIHLLERDYFLHLDKPGAVWPPETLELLDQTQHGEQNAGDQNAEDEKTGIWLAGEWQVRRLDDQSGGYLWRELKRLRGDNDPQHRAETWLREIIVRFPSAPLFGTQSQTGFQVRLDPIHQHTMRLLTSPGDKEPEIKKLFLMFNGVNEIDDFEFYYDLAALLVDNAEKGEVACLITPFPGHLTRYPLLGKYAEKPLQRFITDPSDLLRQYLRFMVEMQWLMSVLVPVSYYPVTSGIPLLMSDKAPDGGRCKTELLSGAIHEAWKAILEWSKRGPNVAEDDIRQSIAVIRKIIGWSPSKTTLVEHDIDEPLDPPQLHVIGYSLGGYLAQCVFFTWPFAIGSCTSLCSGGALHNLHPEKFIHEEEWRAITHGLKYEVESGILEGRISADDKNDPKSVCGIPVSYFTSHFQTFNDIFLQDPHGSYRHRVSEFARRLLFVVGGNDPIVPTQSVLDASPPGGINMIEIAKLTHFIGRDTGEWPRFWLPTIAGIISSLSGHSEKLLRESVLDNLWNDDTTDKASGTWLNPQNSNSDQTAAGVSSGRAKSNRRDSEPLDSDQLQTAISGIVDRLQTGCLLILRNQIPVTLMGRGVLHRRGTVPHYADDEIRTFWERLQRQRLSMLENTQNITISVPRRLNEWFVQRPSTLSVKHLPVVSERPTERQAEIWEAFLSDWETSGALYRFDPEQPKKISGPLFDLELMIRADTSTPSEHWVLNCLPDAWISLSEEAVMRLAGGTAGRGLIREKLIHLMGLIHRKEKRKEKLSGAEKKATENLDQWITGGALEVIRISAAQSSPRFLGERIWKRSAIIDLLTHSALALARSQPWANKDDFKIDG